MSAELPKSYDAASVHHEVQQVWDAEKCFHAEPTDPGEPYAIVIPPPNVTAALHLGHALNNTIQDILIRKARMEGKNAVWLPGTDHAGIATQTVVEKRVMKEEGKRRTDFPREEFVKKIQAWKDEYEQVILGQLKAMGCSCDWDRTAFTMDEQRTAAVREAFFELFNDGLIYRGKRLVNWDPVTLTALADDEVENQEIDGSFYYLKYPVCDEQGNPLQARGSAVGPNEAQFVTVATTRPETMLGDTAVAINQTDPRAAALKGKFVKLPIVDRVIPIIEDDYVVKPVQYGGDPADTKAQLATGFLKVTPAHDPNDYDIGQRHKLPVINVMAPDASISLKDGWAAQEPQQTDNTALKPFIGLSREEARKQIVRYFKDNGLLEDQKPYRHSVGHSYRSHVPIEPYLSDQWYCRVTDSRLAGAALRVMNTQQKTGDLAVSESANGQDLTFFPTRYAKTYQTWHENIRDWCISRQLWWGHRIPVWSFTNHDAIDSKSEEELTRLMEQIVRLRKDGRIAMQHKESDDGKLDLQHSYVCVRAADDTPAIQLLEMLGFSQDPDVLDTWFSSALWPLSTLGWPTTLDSGIRGDVMSRAKDKLSLKKWNPTNVLCTAREIITLWVSRMVMFNEYFLKQVPFKDVFIHAMIQDGEGRKMSKSLGNGVDPLDIISSHGADAMRFTLASMCTHTQDARMPVEKDPTTGKNTSPKFDLGRNFANKMWNAARFVFSQIADANLAAKPLAFDQLSITDQWVLSRLSQTITEIDDAIAGYRFDQYAKSAYDFFWRDFCDWYVEAAKPQMKDPARRDATAAVLWDPLESTCRHASLSIL